MEEEPEDTVLERDFIISGVTDPRTGRVLSMEEALEKGLIDLGNGTYIDPVTGEVVPLYDAMKRGIVYARLADPSDADNPNKVRTRILHVLTNGDVDDEEIGVDLVDYDPKLWNTNHAIYNNILRDNIDPNLRGIREQATGRVSVSSRNILFTLGKNKINKCTCAQQSNYNDKFLLMSSSHYKGTGTELGVIGYTWDFTGIYKIFT